MEVRASKPPLVNCTDSLLEIRKAPMVISKLLFQPFDVRFGQFCKKLETYDRILEHEQESVQLKFASSTSEEQIAEHQAAADFRDETRVHFDLVRKMEQKMTKEDFGNKTEQHSMNNVITVSQIRKSPMFRNG